MKPIKAEKIKTINEKTLMVALDIGKKGHYGYFRTPNHQDIKPFPFHNTGHSFNKFWEKLCRFKNKPGIGVFFKTAAPWIIFFLNRMNSRQGIVKKKTGNYLININKLYALL